MRRFIFRSSVITLFLPLTFSSLLVQAASDHRNVVHNHTVSSALFFELEELARIVDISYCVGMTGLGISKPFTCASRCSEFENFELVKAWNTGQLLSDSCGYIALDHNSELPRVVVAFRGTYSIANTIADLSTVPQEYVPYPGDDNNDDSSNDDDRVDEREGTKPGYNTKHRPTNFPTAALLPTSKPPKCNNCTVHSGFYRSWLNTRDEILPDLALALHQYPTYALELVGHSLGGAVATLAALDLRARGWSPRVTTFGEPRVGNAAFNRYIDERFNLTGSDPPSSLSSLPLFGRETDGEKQRFRRVTHAYDPVPLLPPTEWSYGMHAGELFISKYDLPPAPSDIRVCAGDADADCIAGSEGEAGPEAGPGIVTPPSGSAGDFAQALRELAKREEGGDDVSEDLWWSVPARYRLWQLFFAHRDYFWRIGLCVPGGDPKDWYRKYPRPGDGNGKRDGKEGKKEEEWLEL